MLRNSDDSEGSFDDDEDPEDQEELRSWQEMASENVGEERNSCK